jgi:TraM recognition site of TraD and TraG
MNEKLNRVLFGPLGERAFHRLRSFGLTTSGTVGTLPGKPRSRRRGDPLDDILFEWPTKDAFTLRHLLRSAEVKGVTGSGKSSGSGKFFAENIVRHPRSTCLIIAQKPEDKEFYRGIFDRFNKPLIVVEEGSEYRCNFIDTERKAGADTRGLVEFLTTLGEALDGGQARTSDPFWKKLEERIMFGVVEALKQGVGAVEASAMLKFLSSAAYKPEKLKDAAWQAMFHNKTMEAAYRKEKGPIEAADFDLIFDFWTNEFVNMDDKPRSSGLAGVMNTLHTFNTGLVRDICSTETTITPSVMDEGVSVLVNYPFTNYGPTGRFIAGGFKYLWQKYIMRRHWDPSGYFNVMIMDEYQESATELDARYLAQCRSHGGCLFCLTQTIHSEYSAMSGHGHHHRADQLLSNFGTHIYHTVDAETAKYAASLLGQRRESFTSITPKANESMGEEIFGDGNMSFSISESYQPVLQPTAFMTGLRCGGPPDYCVDGIVIRSGEPFRSGENWQLVSFRQR